MTNGNNKPKIIGSTFKLILLFVFIMTILTLLISLYIVMQGELTPAQNNFFEMSSSLCKIGFGAIVGLLGGKLTS